MKKGLVKKKVDLTLMTFPILTETRTDAIEAMKKTNL